MDKGLPLQCEFFPHSTAKGEVYTAILFVNTFFQLKPLAFYTFMHKRSVYAHFFFVNEDP